MTAPVELSVEFERKLVQRLLALVADREKREQEIEARHASELAVEQQQYRDVFQLLTETFESEGAQNEEVLTSERAEIEERWQTEASTVQQKFDQKLNEIDTQWTEETSAAQNERDEAGWLLASLLDGDTDHSPMARLRLLHTGMEATRMELEMTIQTMDGRWRHATDYLQKCHVIGDATPPEPEALPPDLLHLHEMCIEALRESEPIQKRIGRRLLPKLFRGFVPYFVFLLISAVVSGAIWFLVPPTLISPKLEAGARDWAFIAAGIGSAFTLIFLFFLHMVAAHAALPDYELLTQMAVNADAAYQRWTVLAKRDFERQEADLKREHEAREKKREAATLHADTKYRGRLTAANAQRDLELFGANSFFPGRLAEIETTRVRELAQSERRYETARQDLQLRRESDFRNLQAEYDVRVNESRQTYQQSWLQLLRDWHGGLREIGAATKALIDAVRGACPDWSTLLNGWLESRLEPNAIVESSNPESPSFGKLSIGHVVADLSAIDGGLSIDQRLQADQVRFEFPVLMSLAEKPSLIIHARDAARSAATKVLQTAMLRFLTSIPPGKVRFTIFDPVGLGANFASFMHLADIDELMVTSRIWTEPAQIEKRLEDLTEHMETVLQTYLRNEYASLDEYNREAGEVAEPYRILVIANFPANFTDLSYRRLISIVEGGMKCGVFVLLSFDESQELPRAFSVADLERHATVLQMVTPKKSGSTTRLLTDLTHSSEGRFGESRTDGPSASITNSSDLDSANVCPFRLADPVLGHWPLVIDEPPPPEDFGKIVRLAGELAKSVRRVEVPFQRVMPSPDEFWTSSTRKGVDVPIGRAGATKLQHLRLGKGTSQHVLIAGKTGSGKSTLLHAFITNAALHYSPDEVEFYLIDFKKGVEFKTYAANLLPHARVIAIESDREFGVSVLQRLDAVLKDRGELYRRAGVQDLAGFRDACPDQPLPRVLLVIDEFQEFFTEDDALSQSAALLFDRLIRQGRAFGIHVVLGSQTLAGAYSLARSTLGQIAVRIALQCSETDAHLILSDENTAARLLSRPGEAIYNDANGLIEGNHPFQVVWLDDGDRETYLGWMRDWAVEFQDRVNGATNGSPHAVSRWPDPVVFEGNLPADAMENPRFVAATRRIASAADSPTITPTVATELRTCWLGEAVALTGPTHLQFGPREGGPVLVIGRDDDAAVGVLATSILALAGQGSASPRFVILDGSLPDSPAFKMWRAIADLVPSTTVVAPRETGAALKGIVEEMRADRDELAIPVFMIVYDLARFRDLKKSDDDFGGFGGFDKSKEAHPSALFSEIIKDGPSVGVFPFAWCDGYQTAQRWLGRELLNRFETRVLFAMNTTDSSNLIDSPAAGRLGPNRALLYRGDLGTLDKFRPYKAPLIGWLQELRPAVILQETVKDPDAPNEAEADPVQASTSATIESQTEPAVGDVQPTDQVATNGDADESTDAWTDISDLNVKW